MAVSGFPAIARAQKTPVKVGVVAIRAGIAAPVGAEVHSPEGLGAGKVIHSVSGDHPQAQGYGAAVYVKYENGQTVRYARAHPRAAGAGAPAMTPDS